MFQGTFNIQKLQTQPRVILRPLTIYVKPVAQVGYNKVQQRWMSFSGKDSRLQGSRATGKRPALLSKLRISIVFPFVTIILLLQKTLQLYP